MSKKKTTTAEELLEEALVPEEEHPYEIPGNWVWTRTNFVAKWGSGGTPSRKKFEFYNGDIPWVKTGDLNDTCIEKTEESISMEGLKHSNAKLFPKHSVAIAMYGATIGKLGILNIDAATNQACAVGMPNSLTSTEYLYCYFKFQRNTLISFGKGGAQPNISQTIIKDFPYALPPFAEQKRIADKVERLLNKVDEAKQLIEEAKETFELRRAAILEKAFGGELTSSWRNANLEVEFADNLYRRIRSSSNRKKKSKAEQELLSRAELPNIPDTWIWVRLGDILEVNPPKEKLTGVNDEQECSFIPMASVSDATGEATSIETRPYEKVKKGYTYFRERDVIFAKITPCMENGKSAVLKGLRNGFGYGSTEFYVLRTNDYVNEKLIHLLVRSRKFRSEAKAVMTGAVGQQRVPKDFMKNYLFPLPPLEEQNEIVRIVESIFEKQEIINRLLETDKLEHLKQSLLSKAFKGELGTNDPSEESTEQLLKEFLQQQ